MYRFSAPCTRARTAQRRSAEAPRRSARLCSAFHRPKASRRFRSLGQRAAEWRVRRSRGTRTACAAQRGHAVRSARWRRVCRTWRAAARIRPSRRHAFHTFVCATACTCFRCATRHPRRIAFSAAHSDRQRQKPPWRRCLATSALVSRACAARFAARQRLRAARGAARAQIRRARASGPCCARFARAADALHQESNARAQRSWAPHPMARIRSPIGSRRRPSQRTNARSILRRAPSLAAARQRAGARRVASYRDAHCRNADR